jgi:hypothetical protein
MVEGRPAHGSDCADREAAGDPAGRDEDGHLSWPGAATLPVTEDGGSSVKVGPIGSAGQGG